MKKSIHAIGFKFTRFTSFRKLPRVRLTNPLTLMVVLLLFMTVRAQEITPGDPAFEIHIDIAPDVSGVVYVDSAIATPGNGSSWDQALKYLSDGTKAAETNTAIREIHVAKGTYYPAGMQSDTTRDSTFAILRGGLKIYGGYPSGGGERNFKTNRTVLSGNIANTAERIDNSYHIMVIAGIPASADSVVVDGFMLTGGNADGSGYPFYNGQEVYRAGGGAMALYAVKSNTLVRNCTFSVNYGGTGGGIINYAESAPTITHCLFLENTAAIQGGGMSSSDYSYPTVTNCIFSGNSAGAVGGGIMNRGGDRTGATLLVNCLFSGNTAASRGGAMYNDATAPIIINCTLSGNSAAYSGGAIYSSYGYPLIRNSIIWGNSTGINEPPPDRIIYSLIQGMEEDPAAHNLDGNTDPLFTDAPDYRSAPFTGGDYRLQAGSLLIDHGSNEALPPGLSTDLAGDTRIYNAADGGLVDIGAYEFDGEYVPIVTPDANGIVYVDSAVAVSGDGSSWTSALKYLSEATTAANQDNVEIWEIHVAKGTYYPTGEQDETGRDTSFAILRDGLKLLGGYPTGGPATEFGGRDPAANPTVLSGDINAAADSLDNSYHVLVIAGISAEADSVVVDGFIIEGGTANASLEKDYNGQRTNATTGGGLLAFGLSANTMVRNCTVRENYASGKGGGIYNQNSSITFRNLIVSGNSANNGAGVYLDKGSTSHLDQLLISRNSAAREGGGLYNNGSGASSGASPEPSPVASNTTISGNSASTGGGIFNSSTGPALFYNARITGNTASRGGGIHIARGSSATFTNATVSGNLATSAGGGIHSEQASVKLVNSIIWGNSAPEGNELHGADAGKGYETLVDYCLLGTGSNDLNGQISASNITAADPRFIDAPAATGAPFTGGDYHLQPGSPAINAGTNNSIPTLDSLDIAGNSRIYGLSLGGIVDQGAHEFAGGAFSRPDARGILYVDSAITVSGDGSSWENALKYLSAATKAARSKTAVREIHVAKGTYYPTGLQNDTARSSSFVLERADLKLYGGYPSGGGNRDHKSNPTILSGDINIGGNTADNSYHVMVLAGGPAGTDSLVVDGFTFTAGNASNASSRFPIFIDGERGVPDNSGGGLVIARLPATTAIRNCTFYENDAQTGGAIMNHTGSPWIEHCFFTKNSGQDISVMLNRQSSPVIVNSIFTENHTSGTEDNPGTGLNSTGLMASLQSSSPRFINCTISGNHSAAGNGTGSGALFINHQSSLFITNSVISGNKGIEKAIVALAGSNSSIRYSLVQGMAPDASQHLLDGDADPLFVDTAAGDYQLQAESPVIDKGFNDSIPPGLTRDLAGNPRIYSPASGGIVDLGAFEFYDGKPLAILPDENGVVYVDSAIAISGDGSSWAQALKFMSDATKAADANTNILEIHVAKGTYYPTGLQSDTARDSTFAILRGGLKIYGGYPNGGGKRDLKTNRTILSGDINAANNNQDNSYHVMVIAGIDAAADSVVVDGFTFSEGNSDGDGVKYYNGQAVQRGQGGGVIIGAAMSSTLLRNCIFSGNTARQGGGMASFKGGSTGASPLIVNCIFSGNLAYHGGGMWNFNCSPIIINSTFAGNRGEAGSGGALYNNTGSSPVITNCILYGNSDTESIYNGENCVPVITYSMVEGMATDPASHNLDAADPLFTGAPGPDTAPFTGGDYRLQAGSPVLNKGNNAALPSGTTADLDGNARIFDTAYEGIVDPGAYEFQGYPLIIPTPDASGMVYVDSAVAVPGNGSSWHQALKYLSDGTKAAETNTAIREIHVAKGTYYPTGLQSDTTRDGTFAILRGGLKIYGGYPTGGGERDFKTNRTVLSGNIGAVAESADNSYHIMVIAGIPASADSVVVDGFMLTGGNANGSGYPFHNGQEVARAGGGAMALYAVKSNTLLRNCAFFHNYAGTGGGLINHAESAPTITHCLFLENTAAKQGGGMSNNGRSYPAVISCIFSGNSSDAAGGGMMNNGRSQTGDTFIANCLFSGNTAADRGGAMYNLSATPIIINCTLSGNSAAYSGGAIYSSYSYPLIRNSVIWGNSTGINESPPDRIIYSLIQGMEEDPAAHNLDGNTDPLFAEAPDYHSAPFTGGDYRLQARSSLIDNGSNGVLPPGLGTDLAGDTRIYNAADGGLVDIGAYEFAGACPPVVITSQPKDKTVCEGSEVVFSAGAETETGALSHQWQVSADQGQIFSDLINNAIYSGTRTAALTIAAAAANLDSMLYRVIARTECAADTSNTARLSTKKVSIANTPPVGAVGVPYGFTFSASGGTGAYTWSVSDGELPGKLRLNTKTGELSGTPSAAGDFEFTIQATDGSSCAARQVFTLHISRGGKPVITFPALNALVYGAADLDPAATASDDRQVQYTSSNEDVALITTAGLIRITGAGTTEITASLPANPDYGNAAPVTRELVVNPARLTVTAAEDSKTYDGIPYSGGGGVTITGWQYQDNDALLEGRLNYHGDSQGAVNAGNYLVTPSGYSAENYRIRYESDTLRIAKASLLITAENKKRKYGQPNPIFSFNYSGFVNGENETSLTTPPAAASPATAASGPGTYPIIPDGAAAANYKISYTSGVLTIVKADSRDLVFDPLPEKKYGDADFDPGARSGNGKTIIYSSSNTAVAEILDGQIHITGAGTAIITASLAEDPDHDETTPVSRELVVNPATLTVTARDHNKVYDGTPYRDGNGVAVTGWQYQDNDALLAGALKYNGSSQGAVDAGVYEIRPSGYETLTNYHFEYLPGKLRVTKARLKVSASDKTRKYGHENPVFTLSFEGFAAGDSADALTTLPLAATSAVNTSRPGSYPITVGGGVSGNYYFIYVSGTLTVAAAERTLAFDPLPEKTYGDADFAPGAAASPPETVLYSSSDTDVAEIVDGSIHITGAGTAKITATLQENANYGETPSVSRELIVHKAPQTIDFAEIADVEADAGLISLDITASSGLPVILNSSDLQVAAVAGENQLEILRLGTSFISAAVNGNENYLPAGPVTRELRVVDPDGNLIKVHKAVSPNSDGINEFLLVEGIRDYPENKLTIINRNGVKVFELENYDNGSRVFRGLANTVTNYEFLPQGTYFYLLEFRAGGKWKRKTGWFVMKFTNN